MKLGVEDKIEGKLRLTIGSLLSIDADVCTVVTTPKGIPFSASLTLV